MNSGFSLLSFAFGSGSSLSKGIFLSRVNRQKKIHKLFANMHGFTLVELNLTMALMAFMAAGFLTIFTSFIVTTTRINYSIELTNQSQGLLRVLVEELRYGAGVRQTNTIPDPHNATGWNTGNTNFVIITAVPALTSTNQYIIDPITGGPYFNEYVYYKQGSLLYKRTLANPDAVGNRSKTSCPPASATSSCPADRQLVDGLNSIVFTLYDQDNVITANALNARSIKIDLSLQKKTFGSALTFNNSVRVTLRNDFK